MTPIRFTFIALALSAASLAQASEITEFAIEPSTRSRAEVQAEARMAASTNEAWSGHEKALSKRMPGAAGRETVRREAKQPMQPMQRLAASDNYVSGM